LRSQGLTHTGYVSRPSLPEIHEANRLRAQEEKKRKDVATARRKRLRRKGHKKECNRRQKEGLSPPTTPESTPEESSSSGGMDLSKSDEFEVAMAGSPPPVPQQTGIEASASVVGERRLALATLEKVPVTWADRRSPTPTAGRMVLGTAGGGMLAPVMAAGERTSVPATPAGGRTSAASAETLG